MSGPEITVRTSLPTERVVQNNDGTFVRSIAPPRGANAAPPIATTKETVEVGTNALADAAKARVARQIATHAQRAGAPAKPAEAAKPEPVAPPADAVVAAPPIVPAEAKAEPAAVAPAAASEAPKPAEVAPVVLADQPTPEQVNEWKSTLARQTQLLEHASGEIERLSKGATDEIRARVERLQQAEDSYLDNPVAATRRYLAAALGVGEDAAGDIDSEVDALIRDLIAARHPGTVQMDEGQKANRESALIKRSLARDRQRAEAARSESTGDQQRKQAELADQSDRQIIARHLESKKQYPHLTSLAGPMDGTTPEAKVLEAIKAGIAVGHFDRKTPPDRLLEMGAELAEKHYRARLEAIQSARPTIDTAAPNPPPGLPAAAAKADVKDGAARQSHGSRTITNADASVAPAGAVETSTPPTPKKPETSEERLRRVMQKHNVKMRER